MTFMIHRRRTPPLRGGNNTANLSVFRPEEGPKRNFGPRGPRNPLKRLDSDKGVKGNQS